MRSVDSIMEYFEKAVKEKRILSPTEWVEGASYANVLIGDETDKLSDLQQSLNILKRDYIEEYGTVAKAKVYAETTDEYKEYCKQKAKIDRVIEFIRISKLQARLRNDEAKNY